MAINFGFFDSSNNDRVYNAAHFSRIFDGIINDGVFMSIGEHFLVQPNTTIGGMNIIVPSGRAWFNGTWIENTTEYPLTIADSGVSLHRIDYVVIEINHTQEVRANSIKVLTGTPASSPVPPELTNTSLIHQYPIAQISVNALLTQITAGIITNLVGTTVCPFVTGVMETMDISGLVAQWESEFDDWFDNLIDQLTENQATNLQAQIDTIDGDITTIQGDISTIEGDINTIEEDVSGVEGAISTVQGTVSTLQTNLNTGMTLLAKAGVTLFVDGGDAVITNTTDDKAMTEAPYAFNITSWTLLSVDGTSGSISIVIEKCSYSGFPGTFTALGTISLSGVTKNTGTVNWNVAMGEFIRARVTGTPSGVKKLSICLKGPKT